MHILEAVALSSKAIELQKNKGNLFQFYRDVNFPGVLQTLIKNIDPKILAPNGKKQIPLNTTLLSQRVKRTLESIGLDHLSEVEYLTEADLLRCENFGSISLKELRNEAKKHGFEIGSKGRNVFYEWKYNNRS